MRLHHKDLRLQRLCDQEKVERTQGKGEKILLVKHLQCRVNTKWMHVCNSEVTRQQLDVETHLLKEQ